MSETGRDHYGLRLDFECWSISLNLSDQTPGACFERRRRYDESNQLHTRLGEVTPLLRDALDRNHFALKCLDRITGHITQAGQPDQKTSPPPLVSILEIEGDKVFRLKLEVDEIERKLLDVQEQNDSLFKTLRRLTKFLVSDPHDISNLTTHPDGNKQSVSSGDVVKQDPPQIFYRLHNNSKQTSYDEELGILCPGWRKYSSADSPMNKDQVIKHLARDDKSFPPFISVSDSPARIINLSKYVDLKDSNPRVLVINASKLQKVGSWCRRSTHVVEDLGIAKYHWNCRDGVQYVTDSHWLIHRWVPQECIETEMEFEDFRSLCERIGIGNR